MENKLTNLEMEICKVIASEASCFSIDDNCSWFNARDLKEVTGYSLQKIGGVMSSLERKGLIIDSGENARGLSINDFSGEPETFLEYESLANLVEQ